MVGEHDSIESSPAELSQAVFASKIQFVDLKTSMYMNIIPIKDLFFFSGNDVMLYHHFSQVMAFAKMYHYLVLTEEDALQL